jgi:hypothetical protein
MSLVPQYPPVDFGKAPSSKPEQLTQHKRKGGYHAVKEKAPPMADEEKQWFDLVKHNFIKPDPATTNVVENVRGREFAQRIADVFTDRLKPEEKRLASQFICGRAAGRRCDLSEHQSRQTEGRNGVDDEHRNHLP